MADERCKNCEYHGYLKLLGGCYCDYLCITGNIRPKKNPCPVYKKREENRFIKKHHEIIDRELKAKRRRIQETDEERRKRKSEQKKAYRHTEEGHKRHLEAMARYREKNREKLRQQAADMRKKKGAS